MFLFGLFFAYILTVALCLFFIRFVNKNIKLHDFKLGTPVLVFYSILPIFNIPMVFCTFLLEYVCEKGIPGFSNFNLDWLKGDK